MNEMDRVVLILGLGWASALDWRYRKIPNDLTFPLAFVGLIFQTYRGGLQGFSEGLLGFLAGAALLYLPFVWGGMGGGDVKLMGALGAFVGPVVVAKVFLATALWGGLFSLIEVVRHRACKTTLENIRNQALYFFLTRRWKPAQEVDAASGSLRIPYALVISCGYLSLVVLGGT